jgi:hypothetical protein
VEGIFPDGKYTLVDASRQVQKLGGQEGFREIDIWKLKLDGTGKDLTFQVAKTAYEAGIGYGIVLMHFRK